MIRFAGVVIGILLIITGSPLLFIWAINTLFATQIQFTLANWFAALIVLAFFSSHSTERNKQ